MPPFPGTDAERVALAVYLTRLGGAVPHVSADGGARAADSPGRAYFDENCSACHGPGADIQIGGRGRPAAQLYEMIGHLPTVNAAMPAFEGSDELRHALADYVVSLPAAQKKDGAR